MSRVLVSLSRTRSVSRSPSVSGTRSPFTVESSRVPIENSVYLHCREFSYPSWEVGARLVHVEMRDLSGVEGVREGGEKERRMAGCLRERRSESRGSRSPIAHKQPKRAREAARGRDALSRGRVGDTGGNDGGGLSCSEAVQSIMSIFHAFHALKRPLPSEG